jgi:rRNA maturation endonuclease Nob1
VIFSKKVNGVNKMASYKQKCPMCKKWFLVDNGNKEYCYDCVPKGDGVNV